LEVRPLTGRTNQIRIHLWHAGHPIVGDPNYLQEGKRGDIQTLSVDDPSMQLHAWKIGFRHPLSGAFVCHEAPFPAWVGGSGAGKIALRACAPVS
jgi:23S rRNA-/tRNA-specific pseudouridylate synthase